MVRASSDGLDGIFHALADPTRRTIVARLERGRATVGELAEPLPMSLAGVSKHVKVLERAGVVEREVRGREHWLALNPAPLAHAEEWLARYTRFWNERLDALEGMLIEEEETNES